MNSQILEVAIGLAFIYLFLSLICSVVNEWLARLASWRPKMLYKGILALLGGDQLLLEKIYQHPLFLGTAPRERGYSPSYIPGRSFALALLESLKPGEQPAPVATFDEVKGLVKKIPSDHPLQRAFLPLLDTARGDLEKTLQNIEKWYDAAMDRVSGWYKRRTQTWIFLLALGMSILLNADTFMLARSFYRDPALRASVVAVAPQLASQPISENPEKKAKWEKEFFTVAGKLSLPLGWDYESTDSALSLKPQKSNEPPSPLCPDPLSQAQWWFVKFLGLLFTALAVSLGAPFWFDMLNKFVNLRGSGKPPEKDQQGTG